MVTPMQMIVLNNSLFLSVKFLIKKIVNMKNTNKFSQELTKVELNKIKGGVAITNMQTEGCRWTQIPGGVTSDSYGDSYPDDCPKE
jgi:hypothetical protein